MATYPDLQALVDRFGGYDKITPEAWAEHDAAVARYRAAKIEKLREEQMQNQFPKPGKIRRVAGANARRK
jgi:hypothetical protein